MKYKPDRTKGRVYTHFKNVSVPFDLDLETLFNVTLHPLINDTLWVKYKPNWTKGIWYMIRKRICDILYFDLNLWERNLFQGHCTPLTQRHSVGEVRLGQSERRCAAKKWWRIVWRTNWSLHVFYLNYNLCNLELVGKIKAPYK